MLEQFHLSGDPHKLAILVIQGFQFEQQGCQFFPSLVLGLPAAAEGPRLINDVIQEIVVAGFLALTALAEYPALDDGKPGLALLCTFIKLLSQLISNKIADILEMRLPGERR
jgi:hypothetical protein